jgi:formate dehydrogenase alpha subunit
MAKEITLTIDGQTVPVPEGTTVLKAAEMVEIDIPRLCYFEGLPPSGTCRLCLVEIEGQQRLAVSCTQRVKEGMVVHTQSERVTEARRFVLELIWSTHPGDCTTCEKSGACDLQRYTYEYDVDKSRYPLYVPEGSPVEHHDPLIERNLNLCILCGRCIRVCREQGQGILDFMERGMTTVVTTPLDRPLLESGCDFCGSCIAVCPVGCLVERNRKLRGREWEFESKETRCGLCNLGCDLIVDVARGRVVRTRPGKDGYLCSRGKFGWDYLESEDRVRSPLVRDSDGFREVDWDEALDTIAERLSSVRDARGPSAIGGLVGGHLTNEAVHTFRELFQTAIGTNNVAHVDGRTAPLVIDTFGDLTPLASVVQVERAKKILVVGPGLEKSYPRARLAIKRAVENGAKLIVLDPTDSELSRLATLHLKTKAGAEAFVLAGIARNLLDAELHNAEFLSSIPGGSEDVGKIGTHDTTRTGIPDESIGEAAKLFAKGRGTIVVSDLRNETVSHAIALLMLTGRTKSSLLPLYPLANPWSTVFLDPKARGSLSEGLSALYIVGADPVGSNREIPNLDFLVVQDLFLTETAKKADVVLPLNGFSEEDGTVLGPAGKLIAVHAAVPPVAPPAWQTFSQLSMRLGPEMKYRSTRDIRTAVNEITRKLREKSTLRFPSLNDASGGQGRTSKTFSRFDLPEPSWTARSQIQEVAVEPSVPATQEVAE